MSRDSIATIAAWTLIVAAAGGWLTNIVKLADMCCGVSGLLLLRAIGVIVAPLGAILGFV